MKDEPLEALKELVNQLEGIGIPDWHGAEGLDLARARSWCLDEGVRVMVNHWHEIAGHPISDWKLEVANDDTRLGYLAWVEARKED